MNKVSILFVLLILLFSCESSKVEDKIDHSGWKTLPLPNGWELQAPKDFKDTLIQGIDSRPGYVYSTSDSIKLEFDSGVEVLANNCNFSERVADAKQQIISGFYKDFYGVPILHKAFIDTVDGKVAILVLPTKVGKGTVGISISECKSGRWLGITGQNLSAKNQQLVVNIYQTLRLKDRR